jgi:hypothetical protein
LALAGTLAFSAEQPVGIESNVLESSGKKDLF